MAKKIQAYVKLQVPAGKANPSPPIGPALGQQGVNIMEFCKQFNARTQKMEAGMPIPVVITVFQDRSFTFVTKTPPVSYFLKKAAGIEVGRQDGRHADRRQGDQAAGRGDRQAEDARSQLRFGRVGDGPGGGLGPLDGPPGGGVSHGAGQALQDGVATASTATRPIRSKRR